MEDGHLTDSHGRTVSFKDTVIIMTSNAGTSFKPENVGFDAKDESISTFEKMEDYFKPEFLNRFDAIITFNELSEENLINIVDLLLHDLEATIENDVIKISVTEEAKEKLVQLRYDPRFGARPLRRVIQNQIENQITDLILEEENVTNVKVEVENEDIVVKMA